MTESSAMNDGVMDVEAGLGPPEGEVVEPENPAAAETDAADVAERLRAEEGRALGYLRRALLAEHAGAIVPELVAGDTAEALEASVAVARSAFEAARQAALAELTTATTPIPVPVTTPPRDDAGPALARLSPFQKIAHGLVARRS